MNSGENTWSDVEVNKKVDKIHKSHLSGCSGLTEPHPEKGKAGLGKRGE